MNDISRKFLYLTARAFYHALNTKERLHKAFTIDRLLYKHHQLAMQASIIPVNILAHLRPRNFIKV